MEWQGLKPFFSGTALLLLVVSLSTYGFRLAGYLLAKKMSAVHPFVQWANCTAYATVAALTVKLLLFPGGGLLAESALGLRFFTMVFSLGFFFVFKNLLLACLAGVTFFLAGLTFF